MTHLFQPGQSGNPGGLPSTYDPDYAEQARKLCHLGATDADLIDFFEISRATLYRWKVQFEDFADAIVDGKDRADDRVRQSLYGRAIGYDFTTQQAIKVKVGPNEERVELVDVVQHVPGDVVAARFWMSARKGWSDKSQVAMTGEDGGPIKVEQVRADADAFTRTIAGLAARSPAGSGTGETDAGDTSTS